VDEYYQQFKGLFPEVRSFEAFEFLPLGFVAQAHLEGMLVVFDFCECFLH
jgi:hypothetical protein